MLPDCNLCASAQDQVNRLIVVAMTGVSKGSACNTPDWLFGIDAPDPAYRYHDPIGPYSTRIFSGPATELTVPEVSLRPSRIDDLMYLETRVFWPLDCQSERKPPSYAQATWTRADHSITATILATNQKGE